MKYLLRWWKNVSIAKKLYFVVGIMAVLIAGELLTLRFAMRKLSAVRTFVGAESLWSKAQKDAVFSLQRFGITKNEKDYQSFLEALKIPEGDHQSRLELQEKNPNLTVVKEGFLKGHIHPDDIDPIIELLRRFYWISYLAKAIDIWTKGDELLLQLETAGSAYHQATVSGNLRKASEVSDRVKLINSHLTVLEEEFSFVLGQGSRWLENMVLSILTLAVLTVESIGLTLAFMMSRSISRGLNELNEAANCIGKGDFTKSVNVQSQDEIGKLGGVVNAMGQMLQRSYGDLEARVQERTGELAKMAAENAKLYEEAKEAVRTRDEFLSIASHELKTPLTSLYLQLQRLARASEKIPQLPELKKLQDMTNASLNQAKRISTLLDELLDLTRLRIGKFQLHREPCDLSVVVSDVVSQMGAEATRSGSVLSFHADNPVMGDFDATRIGQIVANLLSNAIKYGGGKPIDVQVQSHEGGSIISVHDNGIGIPLEQQSRIFERYERGEADPSISGLGLGLYITQQIVRAHGGSITIQSSPDKGSTFTVRL